MRSIWQDVHHAVRSLGRSPGFLVAAVLSLALGIGANTAIFAVVDSLFFRPLPYERPDELVAVWAAEPGGDPHWTVSPADFRAWSEGSDAFEEMTAFNIWIVSMAAEGEAQRLVGSVVRPNFFRVLGVSPLIGSGFSEEHGEPGGDAVVLIGYGLWQRSFGGDSAVVGRTIELNGEAHTILGVMPPSYRHPDPDWPGMAVWRPFSMDEESWSERSRWMHVIGRLGPEATLERARSELATIARGLSETYPASHRDWGVTLVPLDEELYGDARPGVLLMLAAAGFVLLVVSVNLANLMLARSHRRLSDFAVRAALGGRPIDLVRQVLVEAVLVGLAGATLGILLVAHGSGLIAALQERHLSSIAEVNLDARVVGLMLVVSVLVSVAFGLFPALRVARPDVRGTLATRATTGFGERGGRRSRELLIAAELALTVVLLVSAALLGRSFLRLTGAGLGFTAEDVLTFEVSFPASRYPDRESVLRGQDELLTRLEALPGAERAALTSDLPFTEWNMFERVDVSGHARTDDELPLVEFRRVSEGYFAALDIPLVRGRGPASAERAGGREEVVINRSMAERFWPGRDPLGEDFRFESGDSMRTVVVSGLVEDVLDDGFDAAHEPRFYRSHRAAPGRWMAVTLAGSGDVRRLSGPARSIVADLDPLIPVWSMRTLGQLVGNTVAGQRMVLILVAAFATLTLLLGAVGIYGVVAYAVSERTREIGLRSALGATRKDLMRLVLGSSLTMAGIGLAAGGVLALAAGQLVRGLLYGISPFDPISFLVVALVLGGTAVAAAALPARRAASVDPAEALRNG